NSPNRRATRTAMTPATILMTVFAPEDLGGRGRTKAFGVRGSLIIANCLTRESVRSDQNSTCLEQETCSVTWRRFGCGRVYTENDSSASFWLIPTSPYKLAGARLGATTID